MALGTAGVLGFFWISISKEGLTTVYSERNFFGIIHVMNGRFSSLGANPGDQDFEPDLQILVHGTTVHGAQHLAEERRNRPLSYYGLATGIGLALEQRSPNSPLRIGVIGLGTGALAGYGVPGDRFRFYEIDPGMIRSAGDEGYFSFLSDSAAEVEVVQGDARLLLQAELETRGGQEFDVLVLSLIHI